MRFRASANTSAAVSNGCSRISLRTKLAFFIPALRDLRASSRSSSSVNRTVRIAIVKLMIDVCHLYVNRSMLDQPRRTGRHERQEFANPPTDRPSGLGCDSDRDLEALSTVYAVHGKVPSVSREDNVGFQVFSENNQSGVCEVHGTIRILHHELARAAQGRGACRHEHRATRQHEIQTGNGAAGNPRQKVRRLRQDRLTGDHLTLPSLKKPNKFPVTALAAVEQRD